MSIAVEACLRNVTIETDCVKLFSHLRKDTVEATAFGVIVHDILHLAKKCFSISYSHVKRSGNEVAHDLAKLT